MNQKQKTYNLKLGLVAAFVSLQAFSFAQDRKGIVGTWWDQDQRSRIEVAEENGKFYGTIVWIKKDSNEDGTSPRTDIHNPDKKLRTRRNLNLRILTDLEWDGESKEWKNGNIYDPDSGKTYSCFAQLQKDGKLYFKGYVMGMRFLGRSTLWSRYENK
jgi:uncharacterized protein (DUF2147 family)